MQTKENGRWLCQYRLEKYIEDITPYRGREHEFYALHKPYEVIEREGNLLLNEGINELWTILCSSGGTKFDASNAYIGVGDSSTAASATQTGLQASTNKLYKGMDSGYPTYGSNQQAVFKASFGSSEANFAWNEWTVANGNSDSAKNLNRKVESLGTKSGGTWTLEVTITLS